MFEAWHWLASTGAQEVGDETPLPQPKVTVACLAFLADAAIDVCADQPVPVQAHAVRYAQNACACTYAQ